MSLTIPKDSLSLVTGVNGYLGSHVVDQLLQASYRVCGTTRNLKQAKAPKQYWETEHGSGRPEVVVVEDMSHEGAFDGAVKGVAGVVHTASNMAFSPDPNKLIPEVLAGINNIFQNAASEPSMKRFVYTSSSAAAGRPKPNEEFNITKDSWNVEDVGRTWAPAPYEAERVFAFSEPFNWNGVLKHLRALRPDHKFMDDFCDDSIRDRSKVQNDRGAELLQTLGRPGWTSLKELLKNLLDSQSL